MNEVTLSSGVKVIFRKMSTDASQEAFSKFIAGSKLDKKGNLVNTDDMNANIELLMKMASYNNRLISFGVELAETREEYFASDRYTNQIPKKWLQQLRRADYDLSKYNLDDDEDLDFLFLRYYAFASAEDWRLLSENVLNIPTA